jgi:hypothetical protein
MVSAWDVYWVMQADSIGIALGMLSFFAGVGVVVLMLFGWLAKSDCNSEGIGIAMHRHLRWVLPLFAVSLVSAALLPSSKTAAAMILVPALTSEQVIEPAGAEARELYDLAKQALRNVATQKQEEPAKK